MNSVAPTLRVDRPRQPGSGPAAEHDGSAPLLVRPAPRRDPRPLSDAEVDHMYAALDDRSQYVQARLAIDFRSSGHDAFFGPQATVTADLPEPTAWVRTMVGALLESMGGLRAPQQFIRSMTRELYELLARRHAVARRRGARAQAGRSMVRRVAICEPADGVVEASVVVHHEGRVRAIALRASGVDGRWLITALEMG